jgi:TonB-dependent SusC/RagA subfamily outer membrane receptor
MKHLFAAGFLRRPVHGLAAAALLLLSACATAPTSQGGEPSPAEGVDLGYGQVDKEHVLGSVTTVQGESEGQKRPRTLVEMLSRIPGVRVYDSPESGIEIQIRGVNSIRSGVQPLVVVDGMVYSTDNRMLSSLDPTTIQSISVLKDAGSTAIYGSRGANGVIVIKTKSKGG